MRNLVRSAAAVPVLAALVVAASAHPPARTAVPSGMVIYRCVAADGAVTLQNTTKCPKGASSQRRVMETPKPAAVPPAPLVAPALAPLILVPPPTAVVAQPVPAPVLRPAPELYACATRDDEKYFGDDAQPTRCAPMTAVSLDGSSPVDAAACESVHDTCTPVPEAERCAAWDERRRVAEGAAQFQPEKFDAAREELERVRSATEGTACAH